MQGPCNQIFIQDIIDQAHALDFFPFHLKTKFLCIFNLDFIDGILDTHVL